MWIQKVWRLFKTRRLLEEIRCSFSSSLSHILAHISMAVIDFVKELVSRIDCIYLLQRYICSEAATKKSSAKRCSYDV